MATSAAPEPVTAQEEPRSRCFTYDPALTASTFKAEVVTTVKNLTSLIGRAPLLVGFLANDDPSARKYAKWTSRSCTELGINYELREVARTELEDAIIAANNDEAVGGILVYYPVFGVMEDGYLQNVVAPGKDVEGLCHLYRCGFRPRSVCLQSR
jgi:methylenetetrahydrofolate dehydrogenase (NAD+)